ncbi:MAG: hypothetical protein DRP52_03050 [Planctomycetota bacterium]|nr:MAG: hypothetical protein DRP52_03050 [Planctomycetota bacterium]
MRKSKQIQNLNVSNWQTH